MRKNLLTDLGVDMPQYTYKCLNNECGIEFDSIEKIEDRKFSYCKICGGISKRKGIELNNPPKLIAGCGGFHKPSFGDRKF